MLNPSRIRSQIRSTTLVGMSVAAAILAGCAADGSDPSSTAPASGTEVRVEDNRFEPANLEIEVGETVTWTWQGRAPHDVVGDDFDSGIERDGTFSHTFDEPGTYGYACTLHPGMDGQITVVGS
jgi:plastocyanin